MLLKGISIGFLVGALGGPMVSLCIRRTLTLGALRGMAMGLGAGIADALYGIVGAFGLTSIASFLLHYTSPLTLVGGATLCYLGIQGLRYNNADSNENNEAMPQKNQLLKSFSEGFFLTLANPTTILFFGAVFTSTGLATDMVTYYSASLMVTGVFIGSLLWWFPLSLIVGYLRDKLNKKIVYKLHQVLSIVIIFFGIFAIIKGTSLL